MICATGGNRATLPAVSELPYLLTEDEAAELLGMSASNLRQRRRRRVNGEPRECPAFIRLGRRIRYLSAEVTAWGMSPARDEVRYTSAYTPDHRTAGQYGTPIPDETVLTDAQVCAVLRISARDARDLRADALDGRPDAYPAFSREGRRVVVRRHNLVRWIGRQAKLNESLDDALDRRAS